MKEQFIELLKKNKAYTAFISNLPLENKINYFNYRIPGDYLAGAFIWRRTKQGEKYWREIDNKWFDIVFKNETK
jgi:hypothetical protein